VVAAVPLVAVAVAVVAEQQLVAGQGLAVDVVAVHVALLDAPLAEPLAAERGGT
jgi:hypothetical protein